jgi:HEAT repeat protein
MNKTTLQNLIDQLGSHEISRKREAFRVLVRRGEETMPAIISAMKGNSFNDFYLTEHQQNLLDVLATIGEKAIDQLFKLLEMQIPVLSYGVCNTLVKIGPSCIRKVEELLKVERVDFRCAAVRVLAGIGNVDAIEILATVLRGKDPSVSVREAAAEALAAMNSKRALRIIGACDDDIPSIRRYAAIAMGKLGDTAAIGPLITMLPERDNNNDQWNDVIKNAEWALGEICERRGVTAIHVVADVAAPRYSIKLASLFKRGSSSDDAS